MSLGRTPAVVLARRHRNPRTYRWGKQYLYLIGLTSQGWERTRSQRFPYDWEYPKHPQYTNAMRARDATQGAIASELGYMDLAMVLRTEVAA